MNSNLKGHDNRDGESVDRLQQCLDLVSRRVEIFRIVTNFVLGALNMKLVIYLSQHIKPPENSCVVYQQSFLILDIVHP
jgi:hypothetical protein